jgi:class 3 adenylate cyclase
MGEDETGTWRAVRERREEAAPILAARGGRLFKTMRDGMLIEFPSIVSAVECGLAMQKQMAERNAASADGKR